MKHILGMMAIAAILLAMAVPSGESAAGPPQKEEGRDRPPVIMWEPADANAWTLNGRAQVMSIIERLQAKINKIPPAGPVTPGVIREIAAIYGDNGSLTGDEGTTYHGAREIALYFSQLALCRKISDLRLEIKFVYALEYTDRARDAGGLPEDVVHCLYFVLSCSFHNAGHPYVLASSTSCPHSRMCECDNGK